MHDAHHPVARYTLERLSASRPMSEQLAQDVRDGLTRSPKILPPKYLYDERGSRLFEAITRLSEYYPTRTELGILEEHAERLVGQVAPTEIVELGSGSSRKTGPLLEVMHRGGGNRYVCLDVSASALEEAAQALVDLYPWLEVDGFVGDLVDDFSRLPVRGRRLVTFLGSTLGNLLAPERASLLRNVASNLQPGEAFLLGADLVKPAHILVPAYDDSAGVTAAFNRNLLQVLNRELDADFPLEAFAHRAVWNAREERIEMHLVARRPVEAHIRGLGMTVRFDQGEPLITEYSCKFHVHGLRDELEHAGLQVRDVVTDPDGWFASILAVPA